MVSIFLLYIEQYRIWNYKCTRKYFYFTKLFMYDVIVNFNYANNIYLLFYIIFIFLTIFQYRHFNCLITMWRQTVQTLTHAMRNMRTNFPFSLILISLWEMTPFFRDKKNMFTYTDNQYSGNLEGHCGSKRVKKEVFPQRIDFLTERLRSDTH